MESDESHLVGFVILPLSVTVVRGTGTDVMAYDTMWTTH